MTFFAGALALVCLNLLGAALLFDQLDLSGWYLIPWAGWCVGSGWVWGVLATRYDL